MSQYSIVVLDTDEKRNHFFEGIFLRDEHQIKIFNNIASLIDYVHTTTITAFLIEYNTLTAENRADVIEFFKEFSHQSIFLYNVPDNANQRLAFYALGAKRVFDKSHPLDEIHYALVWPLKNLKKSEDRNLLISSGKIEDVSIKTLIHTLSRESRSGILKIVTTQNSGKIYFKDGLISHAQVGLHTGQKALLHILFWQEGSFTFNATPFINETVTVHVSAVTMFLVAEELQEIYLNNLNRIGSLNSVIQVKYAGDLNSSSITIEDGFRELLLRPVLLNEIIENDFYTCFETAAKLAELKDYGFLQVNEPDKKEKIQEQKSVDLPLSLAKLLNENEASIFIDQLGLSNKTENTILVISTKVDQNYQFMRRLVQDKSEIAHDSDSDIFKCRLEVADKVNTVFTGLEMSEIIFENIQKLNENIAGIIFLIDAQVSEKFEYSGYVIRRSANLFNLPWIPALLNVGDDQSLEQIKTLLNIPGYIPFLYCDPQNENDVRDLLMSLKTYESPKVEDEPAELETEKGSDS